MRHEIGGEFWTGCQPEGNGQTILPNIDGLHIVLSGRTALDCVIMDILRSKHAGKAYLPSYCCHTMIEPFLRHGFSVEFYETYSGVDGMKYDLQPETDCNVILLMEYFGFESPELYELAAKLRKSGKTVIYDATHSLLMPGYRAFSFPADYIYGSVRKWTDINMGFCMRMQEPMECPELENSTHYTELRNRAFDIKEAYICGATDDKQTFLQMFSEAESNLEQHYRNKAADQRSFELLAKLDAELLRQRRRENAICLTREINAMYSEKVKCLFPAVKSFDCPLFVPILVDPALRNALHEHLVTCGLYFPRHWPRTNVQTFHERHLSLYNAEISCICDQRYTPEDMQRIAEEIGRFLKNV